MLYTIEQIKKDLHATPDAEQDADKEEYVYIAIRKALDYLYTSFPERFLGVYTIPAGQLSNAIAGGNEQICKSPRSYGAKGKAYYFEVSGNGKFSISDDNGTITTTFSHGEFTAYKGFCSGNITIDFGGDLLFYIRNVAVYNEILSHDEKDIPAFSASVSYDFLEITKEQLQSGEYFYPFCGFVKNKFEEQSNNGKVSLLEDYVIEPDENGSVLVVNGYSLSQKRIYYKKAVPIVDESTVAVEIPCDLYNIVFLSQLAAQFLVDEQSPVYDRLGYDARTVTNMKQAVKSTKSTVSVFVNEEGW